MSPKINLDFQQGCQGDLTGKNSLFNKWCWDNQIFTAKEKRRTWNPTSHHIQKLKWIKDPNIRVKTVKPLEESIGVSIHDLGLGNGFLIGHQKHKS